MKKSVILSIIIAVLLLLTVSITGCSSTPAENPAISLQIYSEKDIAAVYHSE